MRLSRAVRLIGGAGFPHAEQGGTSGVPFMKVSDLVSRGPSDVVNTAASYVDERQVSRLGAAVVPAGSVLLPKIGAAIRGRHRRVRIGVPAAFDNNVLALVPENVEGRYLAYWAFQLDLEPLTQPGAVASLDMAALRAACLPSLSRELQMLVADFLDRECARIARLEKSSRALAADALSPALSRFAELVQPWPPGRIGYRFTVQLGKMLDEKRVDRDDVRPYLRNTNVQWDRLVLDDLKSMTFSASERRRYDLRAGDLLVCEGGQPGRSAVCDERVVGLYFQKALMRVRPRGADSTRYLMWCLRLASERGDFAADGTGSTILHLPAERLIATRVPLPPPATQFEILHEVDPLAAKASSLISELNRLEKTLAEYLDALITEAVTGHLDVTHLSEAQMDESIDAVRQDERPEVLAS